MEKVCEFGLGLSFSFSPGASRQFKHMKTAAPTCAWYKITKKEHKKKILT